MSKDAQHPLQIVVFDHVQLDVDVVDEQTGMVLGRPWLTTGVDLYSRAVWSMYVSLEPPSDRVIRKAIEFGLFPKHAKDSYATEHEWEVFGIPDSILLQSSSEFLNQDLVRIITEVLGAKLGYCPPYDPRFGANMERTVGSLYRHSLEPMSYTLQDSHKQVVFTLNKLRGILTAFITDVYHMTAHHMLPPESAVPHVRYKDGLMMYGPPRFVSSGSEEELRISLLPTAMRPYTRNGVRINNIQYRTDSLSQLAESPRTKHEVKYDVEDISRIYLRATGTQEYVVVPAVSPEADV